MMLTFAFLVTRGSWTRSWLPVAARAARFQAPPAYFPASPCTPKAHPVNCPTHQPTRRGQPASLLQWLVTFSLVLASSTMAPCPLSNRLDANPFPQMEGGWHEQHSASRTSSGIR